MTATTSPGRKEDCGVGTFKINDKKYFLPTAQVELERSEHFVSRILSTFHFRTGGDFLVVSLYDHFIQFLPIERAAMDAGFVVCNADDAFFDAGRVESILRRFDIKAVATISNGCLDGLQQLEFDINKIFGDAVVWAYPDAIERLSNSQAITRQFAMIGPAIGMECAKGNGLHIDHFEWQVDCLDGEILLTSILPRSTDFNRFATGVQGWVESGICNCGIPGKRVHLNP